MTPVWPFILLEDILSVPVQELIRYSPDLYHLRSRHHYGEPPAIAKHDDDVPGAHHINDLVNAICGQEHDLMGILYPDHDDRITDAKKLDYRNRGLSALGTDPVEGRFDLDVSSDMILGKSWKLPQLDGYIRYMSFKHDWGRFPQAEVVDLILRNSTSGSVPSAAIRSLPQTEEID